MAQRVLIVEDDPRIGQLMLKNLSAAGFDCETLEDGMRAIERLAESRFDLVILDLMLPGMDGLEVCRRIRSRSQIPILMVTARKEEADVVLGLELGADDYLTKPFGTRELVARARALLRRTQGGDETPLRVGSLVLDPGRRRCEIDGREIDLTTLEFDLLRFLALHPGKVYSRERLLEQVWGRDRVVDLRSIDSLVSRVRKKIEPEPDAPRYLQTVWGAGYRLAEGK